MNKTLIAGVGNIFLGDDAFGVEVVQRLRSMRLPESVTVRDFGIRSYDLAYALMDEWDLVILVDAVPRGEAPGTIYTIEPELPRNSDATGTFDAHSMNPVSVLRLVNALGGSKVKRLMLVGCEPASVEPRHDGNLGLSEPVQQAVDGAIDVIQEIIRDSEKAVAA